jgi:hypothetical protein
MRRLVLALICAAGATTLGAVQPSAPDVLTSTLRRAGERVEHFFRRAQSLVCLEIVHLQPLNFSMTSTGLGRTVESELRVSWPAAGEDQPSGEARTLRQLLNVNGQPPRKNDAKNCTTPEQESSETQPLSLLLPSRRRDYVFTHAGVATLDGRGAIMIDYREVKRAEAQSRLIDGRDDCVSVEVEGGTSGRLWIDGETFDVLRLDQQLDGWVDIPLPRTARRMVAGYLTSWTLERMDTSTRFRRVTFQNPNEALMLPESSLSLRIMRGAETPRLRTTVEYRNYQRFLTGGRIVGN